MAKNRAVESDKKLAKAFPKGISVPQLLYDVAAWYRERPAGCIGGIELFSRKVEDFLPAEADINSDFALFFNMRDGGAAGLWLKDEIDPHYAPFVLIDSEGGFYMIAPNFSCFLDRLTKQQFSTDLSEADFRYDAEYEETPSLIPEFSDWLQEHPIAAPIIKKIGLENYLGFDDGKCQNWLDKYIDELEKAAMADPDKRAISEILTSNGFLPDAGEFGFDQIGFRVFAVGETMIIKLGIAYIVTKGVNDLGSVKKSLQSALRPYLFSLRTKHAREKKGEGLWPAASLSIDNTGRVDITPDYHYEFAIGYDDFSSSDFASDQKLFARKKSKLAPWHKAIIEQGS